MMVSCVGCVLLLLIIYIVAESVKRNGKVMFLWFDDEGGFRFFVGFILLLWCCAWRGVR
jgi:hypothetical protein